MPSRPKSRVKRNRKLRKLEEILNKTPSENEYFNLLYSLADPLDSGLNAFTSLSSLYSTNVYSTGDAYKTGYTSESKPKDTSRTWALIDRTLVLIGFAFIEDGLQ